MVARQVPAPQIFANLQSMPHTEVPAQGLTLEPTLETNNSVALYRSSDRHGRRPSWFRLDRLPKLADRLLHRDDQRRQPIRCECMIADIARDDFCYRAQVDASRRVVAVHDTFLPADSFLPPLHKAKREPRETLFTEHLRTPVHRSKSQPISRTTWLTPS